jgi:hypothetical protein
MHFEHHTHGPDMRPLPHMAYVTGSAQEPDGGVSVMIEIPPVAPERRQKSEGDMRRHAINLVKSGKFKDVSVQHWVDLAKVDENKMDVTKKIVEISLTTQGALDGSNVRGHQFLDRSTRRTASGRDVRAPVVGSRLVFPKNKSGVLEVPKHIMASISSMNERARRIEARIAMEQHNTKTPVEAHLLQQLEEKERLLKEKEAQMPALVIKASRYDELVRKQTEKIKREYTDTIKATHETALRVLEENGCQNDPEAVDFAADLKKRLSEPLAQESNLDFSDPSQVSIPVDEFIKMMRSGQDLQFAFSLARNAAKRATIPAAAISEAIKAAPPVVMQSNNNISPAFIS